MGYAVNSVVMNNKSNHPVQARKIANALKPCLSYRLKIAVKFTQTFKLIQPEKSYD
jgi:hypothetical protein